MDHLESVKQYYIHKPYQFWVDVIENRTPINLSDALPNLSDERDISEANKTNANLKITPEWETIPEGPILVSISDHGPNAAHTPERLTSFVVIPPGADEEHSAISN